MAPQVGHAARRWQHWPWGAAGAEPADLSIPMALLTTHDLIFSYHQFALILVLGWYGDESLTIENNGHVQF